MILAMRTDNPEAELYLLNSSGEVLAQHAWQAHRQLSDTLLLEVESLLADQQKNVQDIEGIVVYEGPGSFTGLRIGVSVANTLAYALKAPIAGIGGENWLSEGATKLMRTDTKIVNPVYGSEVRITQPRK